MSEVTAVTGYSGVWIRQLMQRYNQAGVDGLGDQHHNNSGAEPLLSDVEQAQLWQALQGPAPGEDCGVDRRWLLGCLNV